MCERHSFVQDKRGKIYNGGGFEESHSMICSMNGIDQDAVNMYEWQPPDKWPDADPLEGIRKDCINFDEKKSHLDAICRYLKKLFPAAESFETYFIDESWHGKEIETSNGNRLIVCKNELFRATSETPPILAYGAAQLFLSGSSTVQKMSGSSTVQEMCGSSTVQKMWDSSTVQEMWDLSTVQEMCGSSTAVKWGVNAEVQDMYDKAVLIDRSVYGKVTVRKARKKSA